METFTQIIFPQKKKDTPLLMKPAGSTDGKQFIFWFKDVLDYNTKEEESFVMVKCPECNFIYEFIKIDPRQKELINENLHTNLSYYKIRAISGCPRCKGNYNSGYA